MDWSDLIGRQLGNYEVIELLGRGGSSRVFRARDVEHERDVALKVIRNEAEDRVGFVRRFQREIHAIKQLHHPNIVAVYDDDETEELVYLVMQCVTGGTLRQQMGRPLPVTEAVGAIIQMSHALHHAHMRGIIHRDVKPSNMLVDADNPRMLLLTDFGIAKLQGLRGLTKSGTTIGTPEYMAPEQAEGKEIDQRADVYSLGCVLYEALAGRPPFVGPTPVSVLFQQVHRRPDYLRGLNADVPIELGRIVDQALAKRPEERFGTAEAFAQALYRFTESDTQAYTVPTDGATTPNTLPVMRPAAVTRPLGANWPGMGEEGLDALFPDDPEARAYETGQTPQGAMRALRETAPAIQEPDAPVFTPPPIMRLPSKTRPLSLPLMPDGRLDIEALAAEVERERIRQGFTTPSRSPTSRPLTSPPPAPSSAPRTGQGEAFGGWQGNADPFGWREPPTPPRTTGKLPGQQAAAIRPRNQGSQSEPLRRNRDNWRDGWGDGGWSGGRSTTGAQLVKRLVMVAALIILALALGIGVSSALGLTKHQGQATTVPTATTAATQAPTATATPNPTATTTPNPQTALDKKAAASFRAVTLATFSDHSCSPGNSTSHFASGQTMYINLCTSSSALAGPMTIVIRHNGQTVYKITSGVYLSPSAGYSYYRYGIASGTYDVLVTLPVNGQTAVARDLTFTIG
ncbi:MAG: Serine/threonine protein kinase PrkC, regulator of stationary phase [Ktedonobacterales bacterium]|jgi:serine/threonine-protein kinase|nr:MAG: Serine/threonine protein kinase PrkC, regulator of stationary phase [Ktedonobacterales bacterium]